MSTSPWGGRIVMPALGIGSGSSNEAPADTAFHLAMMNNAMHWADESGSVLVCDSGFDVSLGSDANTKFNHLITWGPFNLRVGVDGIAFPIRTRLAGYRSVSDTTTFRLVVSTMRLLEAEMLANGTNVQAATTNSATDAWLGEDLLTFDESKTIDMLRSSVSTLTAVGGTPLGVEVYQGWVSVWAQSGASSSGAHLTGVYAAEYVGT